jgi:hypothetical protein
MVSDIGERTNNFPEPPFTAVPNSRLVAVRLITRASAHLSSFDTKDVYHEVVAPAADSAFHSEAVFAWMLPQQR